MKIPTDAVILYLLAALVLLSFSSWREDTNADIASAARQDMRRRELAIKAQRTLDDIYGTIRSMRAEATRASPQERAAIEQELAGVESLYQQTRRQLLLLGAEDDATRGLIERSLLNPPPQ